MGIGSDGLVNGDGSLNGIDGGKLLGKILLKFVDENKNLIDLLNGGVSDKSSSTKDGSSRLADSKKPTQLWMVVWV